MGLVIFVRSKDIGVLQADKGGSPRIFLAKQSPLQEVLVHKLFGVAVHIKRAQLQSLRLVVVKAQRAVAVGGRAGGIDHAAALPNGIFGQAAAVVEVVFGKIAGIGLRSAGAGPQMKNKVEFRLRAAPLKEVKELVFFQVVDEAQGTQVAPFVALAQMVHHADVFIAQLI